MDRTRLVADDVDTSVADTAGFRSTLAPPDEGLVRRSGLASSPAIEARFARPVGAAKPTSAGPDVQQLSTTSAPAAATVPDQPLPEYRTVEHLSGTLKSVGSDTLTNLMQFFAEGFSESYPDVHVTIESKGSTTAPIALTAGVADMGPMSRGMNERELKAFEEKFGYRPTAVRVAFDAISIYVHKDNPIPHLSLSQADAVFSSTRKRGAAAELSAWGQAGLSGAWTDRLIVAYGRNSASGSWGYFKERVLAKGDFKSTVREQPGASAVVSGVAADLGGCGYAGIGYTTAGVRAVPIAGEGGQPVEPTEVEIRSGRYPISRPLWIYVNRPPRDPLSPIVKEFLLYMLSRRGRDAVAKSSFTTLSAELADAERAKVN